MSGDIEQKQVRQTSLLEESLDFLRELPSRAIDRLADVEAADGWVGQHLGNSPYIARRRSQLGQPRVRVGVGGDEQCAPLTRHGASSRSRSALAVLAQRTPRA